MVRDIIIFYLLLDLYKIWSKKAQRSVAGNINILAGYQQLVFSERQRDLELLQQFEELRQVALWETFGLIQKLFHQRALNNSFRMFPEATAL